MHVGLEPPTRGIGLGVPARTGEGCLALLCALFEMVWAGAQPLADTPRHHAHALTESEYTVLKHLAAGYTDQAIAPRLNPSLRSVPSTSVASWRAGA